jgi:hypothetical protein
MKGLVLHNLAKLPAPVMTGFLEELSSKNSTLLLALFRCGNVACSAFARLSTKMFSETMPRNMAWTFYSPFPCLHVILEDALFASSVQQICTTSLAGGRL